MPSESQSADSSSPELDGRHHAESPDSIDSNQPRNAPTSLGRILTSIGPGLIVAGSIVGSGELIATTKTGAEAGFSLLWLILLGCVIKVFAQIEFGRYALVSGKTTLTALDEIPGPRFKRRGNWLVWYWVIMWLASISQLGGIVGGVGQALAISVPMTRQGEMYNQAANEEQLQRFEDYRIRTQNNPTVDNLTVDNPASEPNTIPPPSSIVDGTTWQSYDETFERAIDGEREEPFDAKYWAVIIALLTSVVLVVGRYGLIQTLSTILVASFTALVVANFFWLQTKPEFAVSAANFWSGLNFSFPEKGIGGNPIGTALAAFGIIGVGAGELITYPYWCLEKGYGKYTGKNDGSDEWNQRAKGWMKVMQYDAWGSMVIYTLATIAFFLLGAGILHRVGLNPEKGDMVRTLAMMFQPVFSTWASTIFLFGAFAVLYSTFFVANAAHARTFSDAMRVVGLIDEDEASRKRWIQILSGVFPILCVLIYIWFPAPAKLVLISGITQGIMLPMLAGAALYFRYQRTPAELRPGIVWDVFLWGSAAAMLVTGLWTVANQFG